VNKTSTDKISSATPFLIWFRRYIPANLQARICPYLDQPYRLALTILDCCNPNQPLEVGEIAQTAGVTKETTRQVLQALKAGGMTFATSPGRSWQPVAIEPLMPDTPSLESDHPAEAIESVSPLSNLKRTS
jgi:hypothetical protein